jgi:hypothetical protein
MKPGRANPVARTMSHNGGLHPGRHDSGGSQALCAPDRPRINRATQQGISLESQRERGYRQAVHAPRAVRTHPARSLYQSPGHLVVEVASASFGARGTRQNTENLPRPRRAHGGKSRRKRRVRSRGSGEQRLAGCSDLQLRPVERYVNSLSFAEARWRRCLMEWGDEEAAQESSRRGARQISWFGPERGQKPGQSREWPQGRPGQKPPSSVAMKKI